MGRTGGLCLGLWSTPPEHKQLNAEGKKREKKVLRIQSPSFLGAGYCAADVGKIHLKVLMEFDLWIFLSLEERPLVG